MTTLAWNLKTVAVTLFPKPCVRETQIPDCSDQQLFTQAILETSANFETREVGFSFIGNSSESSFCLVGRLNYTLCSCKYFRDEEYMRDWHQVINFSSCMGERLGKSPKRLWPLQKRLSPSFQRASSLKNANTSYAGGRTKTQSIRQSHFSLNFFHHSFVIMYYHMPRK